MGGWLFLVSGDNSPFLQNLAAAVVAAAIVVVATAAEKYDDQNDNPQTGISAETVIKTAHTDTSLLKNLGLPLKRGGCGFYIANSAAFIGAPSELAFDGKMVQLTLRRQSKSFSPPQPAAVAADYVASLIAAAITDTPVFASVVVTTAAEKYDDENNDPQTGISTSTAVSKHIL